MNKAAVAIGAVCLATIGVILATRKSGADDGDGEEEIVYSYSEQTIGGIVYQKAVSGLTGNASYLLHDPTDEQDTAWIRESNLNAFLAGGWVAASHDEWFPHPQPGE
jgi:hypothetical protein